MNILQIATFAEFSGWLFGLVFCGLIAIFWYWISHSFSDIRDDINAVQELVNSMEKNQIRLKEQLAALRREIAQSVDKQRTFMADFKRERGIEGFE